MVSMVAVSSNAGAALIDRGGGLIYDTDRNITWLADAAYARTSGFDDDGLMSWYDAMAWAQQLEYGGYTDWRLPSTPIVDLGCTQQSDGVSYGKYCADSEMGHLYYSEGVSLSSGVFFNISPDVSVTGNGGYYWSGNTFGPHPLSAYVFSFANYGDQSSDAKTLHLSAWAVHDGDVTAISSVPLPPAAYLLGSGLIGLLGLFGRSKST
jgi:hypothetical protein